MRTHWTYFVFSSLVLAVTLLGACRRIDDTDVEERKTQPNKRPAELSWENGQAVLGMDTATQNRLGLVTSTLTVSTTRREITAPGAVLTAQDLTSFRNSYVAAQAQLQKSRVEADVAGKEYSRLKVLFDENQNISEKTLQSAEGALQASKVDVRAAEQQLILQESLVQQQWGRVASRWAIHDSPEFQRILDQREVLVQITTPAAARIALPKNISIEIPGGTRFQASLVSPLPRVDPRIQGNSFLYLVPAHSGLVPGVSLVAHLSVGDPMRGVIVPTSAVVWSQGKAWVYLQTAPDRFTRRPVATDIAVEAGFFVGSVLRAGDKVVTEGAQALLSEEVLKRGAGAADVD
jgi:hypothetical protein